MTTPPTFIPTTTVRPPSRADRFNLPARLLHWAMAACVLGMLFIGVTMVVSVGHYHLLVSVHRPLGIAIFALAFLRLGNRLLNPPPPLPPTVPPPERFAALATEYVMYALLFVLPLVGWGMLSAARYPVVLFGPVRLPYILPHSLTLYAVLRRAHTVLAYLFFFTILGHLSAVLFHTLVVRDGLLWRMAGRGRRTARRAEPGPIAPGQP